VADVAVAELDAVDDGVCEEFSSDEDPDRQPIRAILAAKQARGRTGEPSTFARDADSSSAAASS
jgi:hypothetical protein